jgi:hypothetical protein
MIIIIFNFSSIVAAAGKLTQWLELWRRLNKENKLLLRKRNQVLQVALDKSRNEKSWQDAAGKKSMDKMQQLKDL